MQTELIYLAEKIRAARAHIAANLLKDRTEDQLMVLLIKAKDVIQQHFSRNSLRGNKSYTGEANLTHVSTSIGEEVLRLVHITEEDMKADGEFMPWHWFKISLMMGDLFIEVFYQHYQIDIGKKKKTDFVPMQSLSRNLKRSRTHYVCVPDVNWTTTVPEGCRELLDGLSATQPVPINGLIQEGSQRAVIKGWKEPRKEEFMQYIHRKFITAMNLLQQTEWKVNVDVYNAVLENKNKLLDQHVHLPKKYKSKVIEYEMTMARAFEAQRDGFADGFYAFVSADYRGRVYYDVPFFNFQSNDLAKGQLMFANGKPMTKEGLRWMKIHIAASYNQTYLRDEIPEWFEEDYKSYLEDEKLDDISVDKMTLGDRVRWTDHNWDMLMDIAKNKEIVLVAEKPVSLLASLIELYDNRFNLDGYISHIPVPIDGSNNGWQHLGAMSKDPKTGELVGLTPVGIQKDFYVQTAKKLIELTTDAEQMEILGKMSMKHIRKGISKRGSMTRAYSAGAPKIAENMFADCHVEGYDVKYGITQEHCNGFAKNLVKAIKIVCPGPLKTMKFLQKIAAAEITSNAAKEQGRKMIEWTTESGFPVEYTSWVTVDLKERGTICCTLRDEKPTRHSEDGTEVALDTVQIKHVGKANLDIPKVKSFMSGISPNWVHSADSTHMALVINEFRGDFGAVHDSFAVHASEVPRLLNITKEVFIKMYDVENYYDEIERSVLKVDPDSFEEPQPVRGKLDISKIRESSYFFA